ncbi:MAG: hypothetical protein ABSF69_23885 [Polyangiaceae bacterium]|jgi:hypothetical protein
MQVRPDEPLDLSKRFTLYESCTCAKPPATTPTFPPMAQCPACGGKKYMSPHTFATVAELKAHVKALPDA